MIAHPTGAAHSGEPLIPPRRVCIVEDDPGVRDLLRLMCETATYPVATFDSVEAFLAAYPSRTPPCDLLLLDFELPGASGLELLKILRTQGFERPIVMISGNADTSTVVEAMKLGATDFFDKPFNVRSILERISELTGPGH